MKFGSLLLAALLIATPAYAQTPATITLKCTPYKEAGGKPVTKYLETLFASKLTELGFTNVTVKVSGAKVSKTSTLTKTVPRDLYLDSLSMNGGGATPYGFSGLLGGDAAALEMDLICPVKLEKIKASWSGSYTGTDNKTQTYKKQQFDLSTFSLPGVYLPQ